MSRAPCQGLLAIRQLPAFAPRCTSSQSALRINADCEVSPFSSRTCQARSLTANESGTKVPVIVRTANTHAFHAHFDPFLTLCVSPGRSPVFGPPGFQDGDLLGRRSSRADLRRLMPAQMLVCPARKIGRCRLPFPVRAFRGRCCLRSTVPGAPLSLAPLLPLDSLTSSPCVMRSTLSRRPPAGFPPAQLRPAPRVFLSWADLDVAHSSCLMAMESKEAYRRSFDVDASTFPASSAPFQQRQPC
jgi:hypothetical protein